MKRTTLLLAFLALLMNINPKPAKAQSQQGIVTVQAGVGYSLVFALIKAGGHNSYGPLGEATVSRSVLPVFNVACDYRVMKWFSIGAAGSYQSATLYWNNYPLYSPSQGPFSATQFIDFTEHISRLNFGIRPLFHFGNDKFDFYMGLRLGLTMYTDNNNSDDPGFNSSLGNVTLPSFQAVFGFNIYFNSLVGIQTELAIGTPYFIEGGVVFRFDGGKGGYQGGENGTGGYQHHGSK